MDTVCRLYEVGRQRLAEEEEDEEDQVRILLICRILYVLESTIASDFR